MRDTTTASEKYSVIVCSVRSTSKATSSGGVVSGVKPTASTGPNASLGFGDSARSLAASSASIR
eukprot:scaffold63_cov306-Pinguiococcus_pyrenoidosus.AAC.50